MFKINDNVSIGNRLLLIAGPCVIENESTCRETAEFLKNFSDKWGIPYVFKASFDKANRSSLDSYRSPGFEKGLEILNTIKEEFNVPILTDVHETWQIPKTSEVVDIIQIPAFLCRQTDLLIAAGESNKPVNIKKGQFMAPEDMTGALEKVQSTGNKRIMLTERGTFFGYHNLVVDMRSLVEFRAMGVAVVFDATHSVQQPGGLGNASGGNREYVRPLARAAAAIGIDALFMEVHPDPQKALSDGPNSVDFNQAATILQEVLQIDEFTRQGR